MQQLSQASLGLFEAQCHGIPHSGRVQHVPLYRVVLAGPVSGERYAKLAGMYSGSSPGVDERDLTNFPIRIGR